MDDDFPPDNHHPPHHCDQRGRGDAGRHVPAVRVACDDPLLTAREGAVEARLSLAAFWRAVAVRRLPLPLYPLPRAPRWRRSELRAALETTRALPAEAKAARRAAHLGLKRPV